MALADVNIYFKQLEAQRNEMRADLKDFEDAVRAGQFTEEQFQFIKNDFDEIDKNYQRVAYLLWLFFIPGRVDSRNRKRKNLDRMRRYKRGVQYQQDLELIEKFSLAHSDLEAIKAENADILEKFRADLNAVINGNK